MEEPRTFQLPHKLSELAQIAVDDVRRMENTPGYMVAMGVWYEPEFEGDVCAVCAAGCVMVCRLGVTGDDDAFGAERFKERFGVHNANALLAIDSLRAGNIQEALDTLNDGYEAWKIGNIDDHALARYIVCYDDSPSLWHRDMAELIADLRVAGL